MSMDILNIGIKIPLEDIEVALGRAFLSSSVYKGGSRDTCGVTPPVEVAVAAVVKKHQEQVLHVIKDTASELFRTPEFADSLRDAVQRGILAGIEAKAQEVLPLVGSARRAGSRDGGT